MHFALPQRANSSRAPVYAALRPGRRNLRPSQIVCYILTFVTLFVLLNRLLGLGSSRVGGWSAFGRHDGAIAGSGRALGSSKVVLVTVLEEELDVSVEDMVRQNREQYARKHGYDTFLPSAHDYPVENGPASWAKVPALRHALTLFPAAEYLFYLDAHTLIMNSNLTVEGHIMDRAKLERLMITNVPIVPPESVIKTFAGLNPDKVDLIITQDRHGLSVPSFILRCGEWTKFFLDTWYDPLYRTYNFQQAERHALEHIVQWHSTVLAKLALVPQDIMNSYHQADAAAASEGGLYTEGDFILNLGDCNAKPRTCEAEIRLYLTETLDTV